MKDETKLNKPIWGYLDIIELLFDIYDKYDTLSIKYCNKQPFIVNKITIYSLLISAVSFIFASFNKKKNMLPFICMSISNQVKV